MHRKQQLKQTPAPVFEIVSKLDVLRVSLGCGQTEIILAAVTVLPGHYCYCCRHAVVTRTRDMRHCNNQTAAVVMW